MRLCKFPDKDCIDRYYSCSRGLCCRLDEWKRKFKKCPYNPSIQSCTKRTKREEGQQALANNPQVYLGIPESLKEKRAECKTFRVPHTSPYVSERMELKTWKDFHCNCPKEATTCPLVDIRDEAIKWIEELDKERLRCGKAKIYDPSENMPNSQLRLINWIAYFFSITGEDLKCRL